MDTMNISEEFKNKIIGCFGEAGRDWLTTLDVRIETFLARWDLTFEAVVSNLSYNYVAKVTDAEGQARILKIGVPNFDFQNEIRTLQAYSGKGCAQLIKADAKHGAMLLERLDPGTMLMEEQDEEVVVEQFMKVWKLIRRPKPTDDLYPTILNWASGFTRYLESEPQDHQRIPSEEVRLAEQYMREITETSAGLELLHGDLHHENILYSEQQGWMAIDPKGVVGDPYFDVVQFMVNHLHTKPDPEGLLRWRVDALCAGLHFDRERLLKAAIALGTLYACWGIEDSSDWKDTYQCVEWFKQQLSELL